MSKILIVDDNQDIAFMLREKLRHCIGGDIRIVYDGAECLRAVREEPPDLLLLDICMPGIDGFEVCRLLKEDQRHADVPVIFLSATYDDLRSKIKGLDLGADDYLVQPVDDLELVTRIKAVLQIKALRDQLRACQKELGRCRQDRAATCDRLLTVCRELRPVNDDEAAAGQIEPAGDRNLDAGLRQIMAVVEAEARTLAAMGK